MNHDQELKRGKKIKGKSMNCGIALIYACIRWEIVVVVLFLQVINEDLCTNNSWEKN